MRGFAKRKRLDTDPEPLSTHATAAPETVIRAPPTDPEPAPVPAESTPSGQEESYHHTGRPDGRGQVRELRNRWVEHRYK